MANFEYFKEKLISESNARKENFIQSLNEAETVEQINGNWRLKEYITTATNRKKLSVDELKENITNRFDKLEQKKLEKEIQILNNIFSAGEITEIKLNVEWKNNRTWGANPTGTVQIFGDNLYEYHSSGSISGFGYDKGSTAFADCINQSLAFRKLLMTNSEKISGLYGHYRGGLSGGVGVSCYYNIFEALGYKMTNVGSGKMFDSYYIVKL